MPGWRNWRFCLEGDRSGDLQRLALNRGGMEPYLQERLLILVERHDLRERIVTAERLARTDIGRLLRGVKFVRFERRHRRAPVGRQVDSLARRQKMTPMDS
jgi:hypothetical protein